MHERHRGHDASRGHECVLPNLETLGVDLRDIEHIVDELE